MVFEEGEDGFEEVADGGVDVVVVETFQPLLHEFEVFYLGDYDFVGAVAYFAHCFLNVGEYSQQGALFDLQHPPVDG